MNPAFHDAAQQRDPKAIAAYGQDTQHRMTQFELNLSPESPITDRAMKHCTHIQHTIGNTLSGETILGKPVIYSSSRVLNDKSGFAKKHLCSGLTFTAGTACAYSCRYCYVDSMVGHRRYVKNALAGTKLGLRDVVIRRRDPVARLQRALGLRFKGPRGKGQVIYASPLVDVAATRKLAKETVELCKVVLRQSDLDIRLLSKSPLLESVVARELDLDPAVNTQARERIIFGLSTGTLNGRVARAIEPNAPSVQRRLEALRKLQSDGWRTFGMLCPILPQDAGAYAARVQEIINLQKCEHVWAEPLNARTDAMALTVAALERAGMEHWADALRSVSGKGHKSAWECYAREVFEALAKVIPPRSDGPRLRFLQYTTSKTEPWWMARVQQGAVAL